MADSYEYLEVAQHIINRDFFIVKNKAISKRPFLYPLFIAISFTFNPYIIIFLQAILLAITFILFNKILLSYKIDVKKTYPYIAIIGSPAILIYSQLVMAETLTLFLLTSWFYIFITKNSWQALKYSQFILVLLIFTKPVFYPFAFLNFILLSIYFYRIKIFTFWIVIPLLSVILFIKYNNSKWGYLHFSSIENKNLVHYNLYYFKSFKESKEKATNWLNEIEKKAQPLNTEEKNKLYKEYAAKEIKDHFFSYSLYHIMTGFRGIIDPGRFDLMTFTKKEDGKQGFLEILNGNKPFSSLFKQSRDFFIYLLLIPIFIIIVLKWILFIRYFTIKRRPFENYYFLILLIYYVLITGPVNCSRYMMPFQLIVTTFALISLEEKVKKNADQNESHCT